MRNHINYSPVLSGKPQPLLIIMRSDKRTVFRLELTKAGNQEGEKTSAF